MPMKATQEELDPSLQDAETCAAMTLAMVAIDREGAIVPLDPADLRTGEPGFHAHKLTMHSEAAGHDLIWMHPTLIAAFEGLIASPALGARRAAEVFHADRQTGNLSDSAGGALERQVKAMLEIMPGWTEGIRRQSAPAQAVIDRIRAASTLRCSTAALDVILKAGADLPLIHLGELAARARGIYASPDYSFSYGFCASALDIIAAAAHLTDPDAPLPDYATLRAAGLTVAIHADCMTEEECRHVLSPEIAAPLIASLTLNGDVAALDRDIRFWPQYEAATTALRRRRYWVDLDAAQSIALLVISAHEGAPSNHEVFELHALASERLREHGCTDSPTLDWARRIEATVPRA